MRKNFFGELIAQPTDSIDDIRVHLQEGLFEPMSADVFTEECPTYKFGGELRDGAGEAFSFDGFETVEDAKAFAMQFVSPADIELVD